MHSLALNQHSNGNDRIESSGRGLRGAVFVEIESCEVGGGGAEEVAGAEGGGSGSLDLRSGVELLAGDGELPGARDGLGDDVGFFDAGGEEL